MAKKKIQDKKKDVNALMVPGCLLVGLGIGMATGHVGPGVLIGLGVGFLAMFGAYQVK